MEFTFQNNNNKNTNPLEDFGINLTEMASLNQLDPIIGRDDEIRRLIRILSRKTKNNPILIGEPGVGKTAIVEGLAQRIAAKQVPENLKEKKIYEIDLPSMLAGASFQGQFEKRLKDLLKAIKKEHGKIIVFIDEIHTLIGTGKNAQGGMDAAQIIKPMMSKGELRLIGATTLGEHRKYIESDPALERRMQKVLVEEPTEAESIAILRGLKSKWENYHQVKILDSALIAAVKLSMRYISDRYLPDKALDLVDEAAAAIKTEINSKPEELEKYGEQIAILAMEKAAITGEKDPKTRYRLVQIQEQLTKKQKVYDKLEKKWQDEKKMVQTLAELKTKIDDLKAKQYRYQSDGEFEKASKLLYQEIPTLEKELESKQTKTKEAGNSLVKDTVNEEEIADIVSKWTKIPIGKLLQNQKDLVLNLESSLKSKIKGQDHALKQVANAILRSKADINDPDRPIGSFIFMGRTGVGKTEVAKTLADILFSSKEHMVRIDMSEYMEKHSVSRLIGAPPGYVGYDQGGQLTEAIRRKPYSLILLDEIEKAHPEVLNVILQVLDDGRATDGQGRIVNFKNTIIIMTTNIGTEKLSNFSANQNQTFNGKEELAKVLKLEFINRIDDIIVFDTLTSEAVFEIAQLELNKLAERLALKNLYVEFDKSLIKYVAKKGYDLIFGARPLKHFIQEKIETKLAYQILEGKIKVDQKYIAFFLNNQFEIKLKKLN